MFKRTLTYLLLMLVVLQSGMALCDEHQLHQSGSVHVTFDESHQHLDELESAAPLFEALNLDPLSSEKWDCQHCCHCHGHFSSAILVSAEIILLPKNSSPIPTYSENSFPDTYEAFLRPPKA